MLRVGLTGPAGAGKSTVARGLAERGFPVLDADHVAHALYAPGSPLAEAIVRIFGEEVRAPGGGIDRAALAETVFSDPAKLRALNALVHPPLLVELDDRLDALEREGHEAAVLEAAVLLRWDPLDIVDLVVGVTAPRAARRERLLAKGLPAAVVERRLDQQVDEAELERHSAFLVVNDGDTEELERRIDELAAFLRERARNED